MSGYKIGYVTGDNIKDKIPQLLKDGWTFPNFDYDGNFNDILDKIYNCNVYIGHEGIEGCLAEGADVVITGRAADSALFLAPLKYEFGWAADDWDNLARGIMAGHLLECAGQVTGGYFADPGYKDVPDLWKLGFPLIEIDETGAFIVTKVEGSGGLVSVDTCKEQMIYEIHNPKAYLTPDATADFSKVTFRQIGENQVRAEHATTHGRPETLKVSVGYKDCFIGEGEISYGGSNCMARAELAAEILEKRIELTGIELDEYSTDFIGCNSLYRDAISKKIGSGTPCEVRLRAAGRTKDRKNAVLLANEVEALYTNGPAGGGGAVKRVSEIVSVCSIFVPRDAVEAKVTFREV